jgi:translation initiation factor 5
VAAQVPVKRDAGEHYRYKMPRIIPRRQSSGNGVKTVILNANTIAKAIYRPYVHLVQWFGYALGSQSKQGTDQESIILNGDHPPEVMMNFLYDFIDSFILCPQCQSPETDLELRENNRLALHCNACGNVNPVEPKNQTHMAKMKDWLISHTTSKSPAAETKPAPARAATSTPGKGRLDDVDEYHATANLSKTGATPGFAISDEELAELEKVAKEPIPQAEEEMDGIYDTLRAGLTSELSDGVVWQEFRSSAEGHNGSKEKA